jgi:hypothetical protein
MAGCAMITITHLTPKQKALLDVMWQLDTMDKVHSFISTLPAADARDAGSLLKIAIWETLELEGAIDDYSQDCADVISRIRSSL